MYDLDTISTLIIALLCVKIKSVVSSSSTTLMMENACKNKLVDQIVHRVVLLKAVGITCIGINLLTVDYKKKILLLQTQQTVMKELL